MAATSSCGDGEPSIARDRRNVSSLARGPSVARAALHRVRASACGHSSSHASVARPVLSRRSCATIASCHAVRRTHSEAASAVPTLEPRNAYGLISDPSFLVATDRPHVPTNDALPARIASAGVSQMCLPWSDRMRRVGWAFARARSAAGSQNRCDGMPPLSGGRRDGRCRCREASARTARAAPGQSRRFAPPTPS